MNDVSAGKVRVKIASWYENYPPGIVECSLIDRFGKDWRLAIKQYDVTDADLFPESKYPLDGSISCKVLKQLLDAQGRAIVEIELDIPLENLTEAGVNRFDMLAEQLM
jgi:hypothetical protein